MPNDAVPFDRSLAGKPEQVARVSPLVRRIVANNGGPFTFTGTCSYIVGQDQVVIVDPGPADPGHIAALLDTVRGETVTHILVTHNHRDHSPGAAALKAATGATLAGCAPRLPSSQGALASAQGLGTSVDAAFDEAYSPDLVLAEGDRVCGPGYEFVAIATPGHTRNHLAFALPEERSLFSGDHVMAWSTSVVAPPDGSMRDYRASLARLRDRDEDTYWPGHGGPVRDPRSFVRALAVHRGQREAAILARLREGDATVATLVSNIYRDLAPALRGAAGLTVLAHLEELVERGLVRSEGAVPLRAHYEPR